ncbi:MAG: restriction endonuclease [Gaiellaceae bacterium]
MAATTAPTEAWHYPPELVELTVKAISLLNKGKEGELDFFRGAGVPQTMLADLEKQVALDKNAISKAEIARRVITRLNGAGDGMIGPRREILNRIVRTESFEQCWPDDRLPAKGVVAEIRDVVNKRDSFTRMKQERDRERDERVRASREAAERRERERAAREQVKRDLFVLFGEPNPYIRAKRLENVLNRLFAFDGLGICEAFHVVGDESEGIVEQIDGAIELDGAIYLVEMKWLEEPVGTSEISPHLVRLFSRSEARGIFISQSRFTDPAIAQSKQALAQKVSVLCELEEIVHLLDREADIAGYFREKVRAAITERRPLHRPVIA